MHTELREFASRLVQMVVDQPEAVDVAVQSTDDGVVHLTIRVAPGEIGMVLGKHGRIVDAIRHLVIACAAKTTQRVRLDLLEPDGSEGGY